MDHAILAPSAAPIWGFCSGSVLASQGRRPRFEKRTIEGNAAHWVGAEALGLYASGQKARPCYHWISTKDPDGTVIDDEMAEGAQTYYDEITNTIERIGAPPSALCVEQRVFMPRIHDQNWGTLDAFLAHGPEWFIWDYKHGHLGVSAEENLQMIDYVEGKMHEHKIDGHAAQHIHVTITIVQPFCFDGHGTFRRWRVCLADLRAYLNQLHDKAHEALTNPKMSAGPHCRHCPAVVDCATARRALYDLKDHQDQPFEIDKMTSRDMRIEMQLLQDMQGVIKGRITALDDQIKHDIKAGDGSSGLTIQTTEGRPKWTVDPGVVINTFKGIGVDVANLKAKTPNQALQATPKALKPTAEALINGLSKRDTAGTKLIKVSDSKSYRAFSKQ